MTSFRRFYDGGSSPRCGHLYAYRGHLHLHRRQHPQGVAQVSFSVVFREVYGLYTRRADIFSQKYRMLLTFVPLNLEQIPLFVELARRVQLCIERVEFSILE